jgi:hypothetical protein
MAKAINDPEFIDDQLSSGVDGDLVRYAVEYSDMSPVNPNIIEASALSRDLSGDEFYDADGSKPNLGGDDFYDATGDDEQDYTDEVMPDSEMDGADGEDYSNLTLISKKKRKKLKTGLKKFGKNIEKVGKAGLQTLLAGRQGATPETPPMPPPPPPMPEKKGWAGLSTGSKTAIIIGGLAVLGFAGYMLLRKRK